MIDDRDIEDIATAVAKANLGGEKVVSVTSEPAIDSEGEGAIKILIELKPGSVDSISGDDVTKTFAQIWDRMQRAGDDRFPMVQYATTDELEYLRGVDD